ncbi:STAS domain-containing protein [Heliobacterium chlorum]|uniref:STAS domain-containing protein n=1 Tax=Heliobacterium chlorum TaxID=2698 RepID=A0ABR7T7E1_HELCL|nr:STAS domain-containing protein [Heliobacterium chlorum]MBC9786541.1 STAS domain-containing protein [Heliobacterium chlorum]
MGYKIKVLENIMYLIPSKKMTLTEAQHLGKAVFPFIGGHIEELKIDMSNVIFIDCRGLSFLVNLHKKIAIGRGKMVITNVNGFVKEVFEVTKLVNLFQIL